MKRLILKTLALINFKGKTFTLQVDGKDAEVFGDNGKGKTTLYDSLCWLLFDKDSQFKSTFEIKNLDADGQAEHNLAHEVKGVFEFDGRALELRKVYAEIWTKKRGNPVREFSGHSTDHYIDGVPVSKREYQVTIAEIASEESFKLLTSPFYFSEKMKWQDRRTLLMELCGDVTDEQVISGNDELAPLNGILNGRRLDDHKKVIAARRTEINNALAKIPVRIDEVVKGMADVTGIDQLAEIELITGLVEEIGQAEGKILSLENGGGLADLKIALAEAEAESLRAANAFNLEHSEIKKVLDAKVADLRKELAAINQKTQNNVGTLRSLNQDKGELLAQNENFRKEWEGLNVAAAVDDVCPCCEQPIPEEKKEEARAAHNLRVAERKKQINATGKENKARIEAIQSRIDTINNEAEQDLPVIADLVGKIAACEAVDTATDNRLNPFTDKITAAKDIVSHLQIKIDAIKDGMTDDSEITGLKELIALHNESIASSRARIALVEAAQKAKTRKTELEAEEKGLAAEFGRLESELFLMESFIRAKVEMLEDKINSMFSMARFKLFAEQINGGLSECCSVTYNGVPFDTSLNTGAKINVGLDIINTLIREQGVSLPVFIDNSESVTSLVPVEAQVVQLIVSEKDKALRVVVK